jgi:phosphatidylserine decarboxylase
VVVKKITNLFAMNERVVLEGDWQHGYFSISPVGATNVGSIKVSFDSVSKRPLYPMEDVPCKKLFLSDEFLFFDTTKKDVVTNLSGKQEAAKKPQYLKQYEKPVGCKKGEEVAFFWLGSTVVLVFEVPQDYQFSVKPGDTVRLGQSLGHFDR